MENGIILFFFIVYLMIYFLHYFKKMIPEEKGAFTKLLFLLFRNIDFDMQFFQLFRRNFAWRICQQAACRSGFRKRDGIS